MALQNENPVILKLEGGLGNQLFQLAAGFFLAAKLGTKLYIDQYSIPLTTVHGETGYGFDLFGIRKMPSNEEILVLKNLPPTFILNQAKKKLSIKKFLLKARMYSSNPNKLNLFVEKNVLSFLDR